MREFGIGQSVPRVEDARLLTGNGNFTDDRQVAGAAHMAILRSPHAAAEIRGIETTAAAAMPGVIAVLTAAEGGLADVTVYDSAAGLSWKAGGGRTRTETDMTPWIGKRAAAGKMPPTGFPRPAQFT